MVTRRRTGPAVLVLLLLAVGFVGFCSWPKSVVLSDTATTASPALRQLSQSYLVENAGWNDAHVRSIGASVPGIVLIAGADVDVTVPAHESRWLTMRFKINDCTTPPYGPLPVQLRVTRWYGTQTVTLHDQGSDFDDARTACGQ